jgi:glycosyltransferase involved in cell wall biosynthesis
LELKSYELEILKSDFQKFELSKIQKIINSFVPTGESDTSRGMWSGHIPHSEVRGIINLSLFAPKALVSFSTNPTEDCLVNFCNENQRTSLIISDWGFPFGGAEAFLEETAESLYELGFKVVWINFQIPGIGNYPENQMIAKDKYIEHQSKDFPSNLTLRQKILDVEPDMIFSHGALGNQISALSEEFGIAHIQGFHFWTGLVDLSKSLNRDILKNISSHKKCASMKLSSAVGSQRYLVSDFMYDIYKQLGGNEEFQVIDPTIELQSGAQTSDNAKEHVLQLDLSVGKGGHIFCDLVERLGENIPFMGIIRDTTEVEIKERLVYLSSRYPLLKIKQYSDLHSITQTAKLILIPSIVDETYSRVAEESVILGIPALTSTNGNLESLLNGVGAILSDDSDAWIEAVSSIYNNQEGLSDLQKKQSEIMTLKKRKSKNIIDLILYSIQDQRIQSVGIFTVNAAQGLGTLAKIIASQLHLAKLDVSIYAFSPYNSELSLPDYWKDLEFLDREQLVISNKTREHVSAEHLIQFLDNCSVDLLLVPEVCWIDNWARLYEIRQLRPKIRIAIIPMLETVVEYEIVQFQDFDLTLYPTQQSQTTLESFGLRNGSLMGFTSPIEKSFGIKPTLDNIESRKSHIRFLHIAGHNPNFRKQTITVIKEFIEALKYRSDISLTITLQVLTTEILELDFPEQITVIQENLSDIEIAKLYLTHDVSIQIPSHEGIGIGFYESISLGIPVITLDTSPHNEVIVANCSGWLLPAQPIPLPDNPRGIVKAAKLIPKSLTNFIRELDGNEVERISAETRIFYQEKFSNSHFAAKLLSGIFSKQLWLRTSASHDLTKLSFMYQRIFTLLVNFGKKTIYSKIPFSTRTKYVIKEKVFLVDRLFKKLF